MKKTATLFRYTIAGLAAAMLYGGTALALPTISNVYPNGTNMFQPSATLTFTANGSGVTNIVVDLTVTNLYTSAVILSHRTSASGLTVNGTSVSAPLTANTLYGATITVYDSTGSTTLKEAFDTITPVYTWEAEDFNYGGGLHIDTGTDQYAGLAGVAGQDYNNGNPNNGNADYRPKGLETENGNSGDTPRRIQFLGTTNLDYDVGWTAGGDWGNYTHKYPAGTYVMFVRVAGGGNPSTEAGDINIVSGSVTATGNTPYKFGVKGHGWGAYDFMPVTDSSNNPVQFTFDGNAATLQELQVNASDNLNFFMLMPVPVVLPSTVTITNFIPDGSVQFQASNTMSFTVSSPVALDLPSVAAQVSATTLLGTNTVTLLTIGNGLSYTGNSSSITVTAPLTTNVVYDVLILANDANGVQASYSAHFDTIVPTFTFEAEDWNYGGGQFIDNAGVNAYSGSAYDGVREVDFHRPSGGTLGDYGRVGLQTENCGDIHRASYISGGTTNQDYDNGNTTGGDWANYTRKFPTGVYNIFVRVARGNSGAVTDAGKISLVTSDPTQPNQTVQDLGKHNTPSTGGWQNYVWAPIMNSGGFPARFTGDGTAKTLRYTFDGAGDNPGFFLLLPAVGGNPPPFISSFTPDGSAPFQAANKLSFVVNSSAGIPQANIVLNLNGANVSGLTFSGNTSLWNVSYPIKTNAVYTAIVTVTDAYGSSSITNRFDTFDYNSACIFQAEDYDFGGGQFYDNPTAGQYANLAGVLNVDDYWNYNQGSGYRPSAATGEGLPTEHPSGDALLPSFNGDATYDYDVGHNDGGNWANYTRTYPAGAYNIYMRVASPNGPAANNAAKVSIVTGNWGTTSQTLTDLPGTFGYPNTGDWHRFGWAPLVDAGGNLVQWNSPGTTNTLRVTIVNGGYNANYYALVPADTNVPTISNLYPNGAFRFQASGALTFTASSPAGINSSAITVQMTWTNLYGQTFVTNLTAGHGLTITGTSTSWNVSANLADNNSYTAVVTITASNGEQTSATARFDTVNPALTFEAEDWDYTSGGVAGLFINVPQTNGYATLASTAGVDYTNVNTAQGSPSYRPFGLATEGCSDTKRAAYATLQDYDVGFNNNGNWANYTRVFPSGVYNIFLRAANGGDVTQTYVDSASLYRVTSGVATPNQTTAKLGTFSVPPTGGWQTYTDTPLLDQDGNYAQFVGGSQQTLRSAIDNGYCNQNYYFLVQAADVLPVNPPQLKAGRSGTNMVVSFLSRTNTTYVLESKTHLTDPLWTPVATNSGTTLWISITNGAGSASGFYHLKLQ